MNNINIKALREGLFQIADGFIALGEALPTELENEPLGRNAKEMVEMTERAGFNEEPEITTEKVPEEIEPVEDVEEEIVEDKGALSKETLEKLGYRDLQKVAKDLDIIAVGKKEELIDRILGEPVEEVIDSAEEVLEEEVVEELVEEIEEVEEEEVVLTKADKIAKALEEYTEEDLADVLSSIGESPKGKRQSLLAKIVKAIEEGKLEFEVEDEEPEEIVEDIFEGMTEPRKQTIIETWKELDEAFDNDEMSEEEIDVTLSIVYTKEDGYTEKLPLDEKKEMLKTVYMYLVDDEGELHDLAEPYLRSGAYACCSHQLQELENGNLYCSICGNGYEIA